MSTNLNLNVPQIEPGKLTEADWAMHTAPSQCCGMCKQGRTQCATPEACQIAEPEDDLAVMRGVVNALLLTAACAVFVLVLWRLFHG